MNTKNYNTIHFENANVFKEDKLTENHKGRKLVLNSLFGKWIPILYFSTNNFKRTIQLT